MLASQSYLLFEILYFWGLIGSPIAILLPGGLNVTYSSPVFWQFMISHSLNVISILFMIIAYRYRPTVKSIRKAFNATNIYMIFIALFNYLIGSNYYYFYLCKDPSPQFINPFKGIASWPLILLLLESVSISAILIFYFPYAVNDYVKREHAVRDSYTKFSLRS
jgi:hypothetical integral membrane protein (TIGR02206 family)